VACLAPSMLMGESLIMCEEADSGSTDSRTAFDLWLRKQILLTLLGEFSKADYGNVVHKEQLRLQRPAFAPWICI